MIYKFYGCSSLSSVTIPENLTSIGGSVFAGCDACSIYVKRGTAILLRLWNAGYMTYDITTHEQLVAPGISLLESTASALKCGLNNPYEEYAHKIVQRAASHDAACCVS